MILHDCEQGTDLWKQLRLGLPTSSQFHRILTPSKLKPAAGARKYMAELLAEWVSGMPSDDAASAFMERGNEYEDDARRYLAFTKDVEISEIGFVTNDAGTFGCSPDGLISDDSGCEIKVPALKTHIGYLLDGIGADYVLQIQGSMWIAERDTWEFISYNPDPNIPSKLMTFVRNDAVIDPLAKAVELFSASLEDAKARLRDMGLVPASERPAVTSLADAEGVSEEDIGEIFNY